MSGVVPLNQTPEEAVDSAFRRYGIAKETVRGNKPAVYAGYSGSERVRGAEGSAMNSGSGSGGQFALRR